MAMDAVLFYKRAQPADEVCMHMSFHSAHKFPSRCLHCSKDAIDIARRIEDDALIAGRATEEVAHLRKRVVMKAHNFHIVTLS